MNCLICICGRCTLILNEVTLERLHPISMRTILEIVTHLIEDDGLQKIPEFCRINRFVRSRLDLKELTHFQSTGSGSKN